MAISSGAGNISIILQATDRASKTIRSAAQELQKLNTTVHSSRSGAEKFSDAMMGGMRVLGTFALAVGGVGFALDKAMDFGRAGAEIDYTRDKFDRLSASIGMTSEVLLDDLRAATRGMRGDAELMTSATQMMALGLANDRDEVVRLTRVAGALNMDMNQLVLTLTNMTTMRFDQLNVRVEGFEEKVKALEATGLSAAEAFRKAFLLQAEEQVAMLGEAADSAVAPFQRMDTAIANLGNTLKEKANEPMSFFANVLADAATGLQTIIEWDERVNATIEDGVHAMYERNAAYTEYLYKMAEVKAAQGRMEQGAKDKLQSYALEGKTLDWLAEDYDIMTEAQYNAARAYYMSDKAMRQQNAVLQHHASITGEAGKQYKLNERAVNFLNKSLEDQKKELADIALVYAPAKTAADTYRAAQEALRDEIEKLDYYIAGPLGDSIDNLNNRQGAIKERMDEVQSKIKELIDQGYSPQSDAVLELQGDYDELAKQYDEEAQAHAERTRLILYDLLKQKLAVGGLTDAEVEALKSYAEQVGLTDEATTNLDLAVETVLAKMTDTTTPENLALALAAVAQAAEDGKVDAEELAAALDILNGKHVSASITIKTEYTGDPYPSAFPIGQVENTPPAPKIPFAHGGSFTVPAGYPNDSFVVPMALTSGERVTVSPGGQAGGGGNIIVQQIINSADAYRLAKADLRRLRNENLNRVMGV